MARAPHNRGPVFVNDVVAAKFASSLAVRRLSWFSGIRRLARRCCIRVLQLSQRLIHARLEVALVIVLPTTVVGYHLHFAARTLGYQGDVIFALQQRARDVDVRGVLRVVVSVHLGIVAAGNGVVVSIAEDVLHRGPQLCATVGISALVSFARRLEAQQSPI